MYAKEPEETSSSSTCRKAMHTMKTSSLMSNTLFVEKKSKAVQKQYSLAGMRGANGRGT